MWNRFVNKPSTLRRLLNVWPPFVGAGISVRRISDDWREADVRLALRWYNQNYVGIAFGGSVYAMADPFYMLLLSHLLGREYRVLDAAATVRFIKPGVGHVYAFFRIDDETLEAIRAATANGDKHLAKLKVDVVDEDGELVAQVDKTVYARRRRNK
ncbi:MAG: DUF4442 domain-containing protein [Gammaproteobacteria bacterium]